MSKVASKCLSAGKTIQVRRLEFVTNNIANSLTPGYKASKPVFQTMLSAGPKDLGEMGNFPILEKQTSFIDFSEAPLVGTGGKLDLAIEGSGFFVISTEEGFLYTRNGQFMLDGQKRLVTAKGYPVMGEGGELVLIGNNISIEKDGSISVDKVVVDKLKVVDFENRNLLQNFGMSLFQSVNAETEPSAPAKYSVRQGFIESSNVNIAQEMVNLVSCLRAYETYDKATKYLGDIDSKMLSITWRGGS
jgi:flagellar basal-body rod protein FlgF